MSSRSLVRRAKSHQAIQDRILGSRRSWISCNRPKLIKIISQNDPENTLARGAGAAATARSCGSGCWSWSTGCGCRRSAPTRPRWPRPRSSGCAPRRPSGTDPPAPVVVTSPVQFRVGSFLSPPGFVLYVGGLVLSVGGCFSVSRASAAPPRTPPLAKDCGLRNFGVWAQFWLKKLSVSPRFGGFLSERRPVRVRESPKCLVSQGFLTYAS